MTRRTLQTNFIDDTFVACKRPISSPENARTHNPAAILEGFRKIPHVPVSAGLSPLRTWCHSSIMVGSRISPTRLTTNASNFSVEFSHCKTVVLSVHMQREMINADSKGGPYIIFQSCGEQSSLKCFHGRNASFAKDEGYLTFVRARVAHAKVQPHRKLRASYHRTCVAQFDPQAL